MKNSEQSQQMRFETESNNQIAAERSAFPEKASEEVIRKQIEIEFRENPEDADRILEKWLATGLTEPNKNHALIQHQLMRWMPANDPNYNEHAA